MKSIVKKMKDFCGTKRNMYKPIIIGLDEAFEVIEETRRNAGCPHTREDGQRAYYESP